MRTILVLCLILALAGPSFAQDDDAASRMVREAEATRARQMTGFNRAADRTSGGIEGAIRDTYRVAPGEADELTPAKDVPKRGGPLGHPWLPWIIGAIGGLVGLGLLTKLWKRLA